MTDASLEGHAAAGRCSPTEATYLSSRLGALSGLFGPPGAGPLVQGWAIHLLADNTTAVAYIGNQGGTNSLSLFLETRDLLL